MRANELQLHVRRTPFVPFRLQVTDGTTYLIRHPELILVRPSVVYIATEAKEGPGKPENDTDLISLIHVVRVEAFNGVPSSPPSNSGA